MTGEVRLVWGQARMTLSLKKKKQAGRDHSRVPSASPDFFCLSNLPSDTYLFKAAHASHASQASSHPAGTLVLTDINVQCESVKMK